MSQAVAGELTKQKIKQMQNEYGNQTIALEFEPPLEPSSSSKSQDEEEKVKKKSQIPEPLSLNDPSFIK